MPYVAILAAGLGVVVTPWHGHHAQYVSAPWKDCSTVVGALVTAWCVVLNLLLPNNSRAEITFSQQTVC